MCPIWGEYLPVVCKWFGSDMGVFPGLSKNGQRMFPDLFKNDVSDKKRHKKKRKPNRHPLFS